MYKLTLEFKTVTELANVVEKLGGVGERGALTTETTTQATPPAIAPAAQAPKPQEQEVKELTPKEKLIKEALALGLSVDNRATKDQIKEMIKNAKNPPAQAQQAPPEFKGFPPQNAPAQPVQPPAQQAPVQQAPAPVTNFDRNQALQAVVADLGKLSDAGVPEAQVFPMVQEQCKAVGAPLGKRLSELEDQHLANVIPRIQQEIQNMLSRGQSSSFV